MADGGVPGLQVDIAGVEIERFAVTPTLLFRLRLATDRPVRNLALRCQIRIDPARRGYQSEDHERLRELFGDKQRWGRTLQSFLWCNLDLPVPAFDGERLVNLPAPCSYDFDVAATKYFHGLGEGDVPLSLLFSGSVFYDDDQGRLQIAQAPLTKDATFALPVQTWRDLMATYYPDTTWLRVRHEVFERLYRYRRDKGFVDWDSTLDSLIPADVLEPAS